MENYFFYNNIADSPLYNLSAMTAEKKALYPGVKRYTLAIISIIFGIIVMVMYGLCLSVMVRRMNYIHPCYKIMFWLGVSDSSLLFINSFFAGYSLLVGCEFHSCPNSTFISGCVGLIFYCSSSYLCLILISNRIVEISNLCRRIFSSTGTHILISFGYIYGFYAGFFTNPPLFSSTLGIAVWDPQIYENRGIEYNNYLHLANNFLVVIITCILYIVFYYCFTKISKHAQCRDSFTQKRQRYIFLQCTIICFSFSMCAVFYCIAQYVTVPVVILMGGEAVFMFNTGLPVIIYMTMNQTIKVGVKRIFKKHIRRNTQLPFSNSNVRVSKV